MPGTIQGFRAKNYFLDLNFMICKKQTVTSACITIIYENSEYIPTSKIKGRLFKTACFEFSSTVGITVDINSKITLIRIKIAFSAFFSSKFIVSSVCAIKIALVMPKPNKVITIVIKVFLSSTNDFPCPRYAINSPIVSDNSIKK